MDNVLAKDDEESLRFLWNDLEASAGHHSSQGNAINRAMGLGATGNGGEVVLPFEQLACWSNARGSGMPRVRELLRRLPREAVQVLFRHYGPRDPSARTDQLGDVASLAEYTPMVEAHREHLVAVAIEERIRVAMGAEERRVRQAPAIIAAVRVRTEHVAAEILRLRELRGERGLSKRERAELVALRCERRAAGQRREDAERPALATDALDRIAASIRIATAKEITTADALLSMLGPRVESRPKEADVSFARRQRQTLRITAEQLATLREQCRELLHTAARAYSEARGPAYALCA